MNHLLGTLREHGLLDAGVLAAGVERGWVLRPDVEAYAVDRLGGGDDRSMVLDLVAAEAEPGKLVELLRALARADGLASQEREHALRRWMFAALTDISRSAIHDEQQLDRLEEAYATLGYPEEMRACSRYYVPPDDLARGLRIGDTTACPLDAMTQLLSRLRLELGSN